MGMGTRTCSIQHVSEGLLVKEDMCTEIRGESGRQPCLCCGRGNHSGEGTEKKDQMGPSLKRRREEFRMGLRLELSHLRE